MPTDHHDASDFSKLHAQLMLQCPPSAFPELRRMLMMDGLMKEMGHHYKNADPIVLRPLIEQYLRSIVKDARNGSLRRPTRGVTGDIGGHMAHLIRYLALIPRESVQDAGVRRWIAIACELRDDSEVAALLIDLGESSEGVLRAALGGMLGGIASECGRAGTPLRPFVPPRVPPRASLLS